MLRKTEIDIRILEAYIKSLNNYLLNNKSKVIKNESKRSEDIETIAGHIYDCFDVKMNDTIDNILSDQNLSLPDPALFPSLELLPRYSESKTNSLNRNFATISRINSHHFKTGFWGQSELKSGIQNSMREQILFECINNLDTESVNNLRSVSRFFNQAIPKESWVLFYTDNLPEKKIDAARELFTRVPVCFRAKNLLDGNVSVQVKRNNFNIVAGQTLSNAMKKASPNSICFALKLTLMLSEIDQMQKSGQHKDIFANIHEVTVVNNNLNDINQITRFEVSYNPDKGNFLLNEVQSEAELKPSAKL